MSEVEGPYPLPDGWVWTTLGEVVDILDNRRLPINAEEREGRIAGVNESELVPYFGATGQVGWIDGWLFDEELILLGEDGAPFLEPSKRKAYLVQNKTWVNNHAHVLRAKAGLTTNRYVLHSLNNTDYHQFVTGTTRLKLNQARMKQIPVPLASPDEQRRIVDEIETQFSRLDAAEAALKRVQANLKRYRASVLKAACEGRLVPSEAELARIEGRAYEPASVLLERILAERRAKWQAANPKKAYKEPAGPDVENLPELPEGWVWATVGQVAHVQLGRQRSPKNHIGPNMRSYLRAANITWAGLALDDVMEMNFSPSELETYRLSDGDILLSEASGSASEVGKPAIWRSQIEDCCFQNTLIRVQCQGLLTEYLFWIFDHFARSGEFARTSLGVGIHHLSAQRLVSLAIPIPPLVEQNRIVEEIETRISVLGKVAGESIPLRRLASLRQSILRQAFSGRLVLQVEQQ